MCLKKLILVAN